MQWTEAGVEIFLFKNCLLTSRAPLLKHVDVAGEMKYITQ